MTGDITEAEQMTALLSGFVFSALQPLGNVLTPPLRWGDSTTNGIVTFRLASGMLVTIMIKVEPVA